MEQRRQVTLLGDSILKGIQVDLGSRRYKPQNEMNVDALESEFQLSIHNDAHFGATVRKGSRLLDRMLERQFPCDMLVMDFGGNDCDFKWKEIAEHPEADHQPNVPLPEFVELYRKMIRQPWDPSHPHQFAAAGQRAFLQLVVRGSGQGRRASLAGGCGQYLRVAGTVFPCGGASGAGRAGAAGGCPGGVSGSRTSGADPLRGWNPPQYAGAGTDHCGISEFWP